MRTWDQQPLNPEHAFLIIEGVDMDGTIFINKFEFGSDNEGKSYVFITKENGSPTEIINKFNQLLWGNTPGHITSTLKDVSDGWYKKTWAISNEQGQNLINNIIKDQVSPPPYSLIGNNSISGSSNSGSSKRGHNCFTWARQKLRDLKDERILDSLETAWVDRITSVTSRHIGPQEKSMSVTTLISNIGSSASSNFW